MRLIRSNCWLSAVQEKKFNFDDIKQNAKFEGLFTANFWNTEKKNTIESTRYTTSTIMELIEIKTRKNLESKEFSEKVN